MRLLTANDIEDEDDDENEHDRRIEEGRDQSFAAASSRRFEYRATDGFPILQYVQISGCGGGVQSLGGTGQILMRIGKDELNIKNWPKLTDAPEQMGQVRMALS